VRRLFAAAALLLIAVACNNSGGGGDEAGGPQTLKAHVRTDPPGVVVARGTTCTFDGDRKVTAGGIVENAGDDSHQVSIQVRFIDADGVRVDLASDSVSDLERGESAHWDASIYTDTPGVVRTCEVSTTAS
jgi:hypothetical protein